MTIESNEIMARIIENSDKCRDNSDKNQAEIAKMTAETEKMRKETKFYPLVLMFSAMAGGVVVALINKLL